VPEAVTFAEIRASVLDSTGELLQNLVVFDVYHDQKLKKGYKSVAIGLILQHVSSTLTDESVEPVIQRAVAGLETSLGAYLRG
jgi:phenylalanyl-tRNA synthetase beta chain